ncbi:transcription factor DIVARICATA [Sorghum bicolor]|uniref:Uncharacterized protein n=1 Tax=Sorghum bicolor TaxID=4558 RepID=C5WSF4_SORBI|nr:transcription factor DIVARICATA [Sorghum bicolor]EER94504.1 hypothetical protein SORBI_3001G301100 [Sorghum bicolor]|eukprot:XP_002467506.1 transcription factor DIVARICATA [Sorghum bicolor]
MDPKFKGEWSASEVSMVKSLIEVDNANNNCASDMNKKHNQIMDELQSGNQHVEASSNLMNQPFGVFVGGLSMGNMEAFGGYQKEMFSTRNVKETPRRKPTPRKESQHNRRFWTTDEHRQFLRGLHVYGRGNWKNISRHFVTSKTPVQVSSHAQKYFLRKENGTKKQRYSINDIGLYDFEPLPQTNASAWEGATSGGGVYNTNHYSFCGHPTSINNAHAWSSVQYHTGHGSSNNIQMPTLAIGQQQEQMGTSSSLVAPTMEADRGHLDWTSDKLGDLLDTQWMMNMDMN